MIGYMIWTGLAVLTFGAEAAHFRYMRVLAGAIHPARRAHVAAQDARARRTGVIAFGLLFMATMAIVGTQEYALLNLN